MKLSTVKKYRRKHRVIGSLLIKNPVLVMGLDLPFLVATSTSLRNAAAISIELLLVHTVTMLAAMVVSKRLPHWQRIMVNAGVSTLAMMGARMIIFRLFPGISNTVGIYLYLLAVNGMTILQAAELKRRSRLRTVVSGAFLNVLGFSFVMAVVSLIRELGGSGTLFGFALPVPFRLYGLLLPFGGFLIMGFVLAAAKFVNKVLVGRAVRSAVRREEHLTRIRVISEEII